MAGDDKFPKSDVPGSGEVLSKREVELRAALQNAETDDERVALLRRLREERNVTATIDRAPVQATQPVSHRDPIPQWQGRETNSEIAVDQVDMVVDQTETVGSQFLGRSGFLLGLLVFFLLLIGAAVGFLGAQVGGPDVRFSDRASGDQPSVQPSDSSADDDDRAQGDAGDDVGAEAPGDGVGDSGRDDPDGDGDEEEDEDEDEDENGDEEEDEDDDGSAGDEADDAIASSAGSVRIEIADPIAVLELRNFEFSSTVTVANEAELRVILAAVDTTYGGFGTGLVSVDPGAEQPEFVAGLPGVIQNFARMIEGSLQLGTDSAVLHGTVPNADALAALLEELSPDRGFPPVDVSGVQVTEAEAAELDVESVDGVIRISGTLPEPKLAERLVTAAVTLYGSENVIDEIEIDPERYALFDVARFDDVIEVFSIGGDFEIKMLEGGFFGLIEDGVEFDVGDDTLKSAAVRLLSGFPPLINRTTVDVTIVGHTDSQGGVEINQLLSETRAQSVADHLEAQGVDPSRFVVLGLGESEPLASNATAQGRAKNRRVIITMGFEDD